ncbi:MAG: hypothetical protein AcusKO_34900 [Acuticoccus sp.]
MWRALLAAAFASWFALEGLRNGLARLANRAAAWVLFLLAYTTVVQLVTGGPAEVLRNVQMHILLVCALIGIAYRGERLGELAWTLLPALALLGAAIAATLQAIAADPHAARHVVRTSTAALALLRAGVGGYQLTYACALLAPVLLVLLRSGHPSPFFAALAGLWLAASALVLAAGFSIAVLVLAVGTALALFWRAPRRAAPVQALFALGALAAALLALDPLLALAEGFAENTKYARKIADLRDSLDLGESVGTASDRLSRYLRSLALFADAPLTGTLFYAPLGKHSQLLDGFARYGVLIGLVGLAVLVRLPGRLLAAATPWQSPVALVVQVTLAIYLTLNNATAAHGAVVYLLLPALAFAAARRARRRPAWRPRRPHLVARPVRPQWQRESPPGRA